MLARMKKTPTPNPATTPALKSELTSNVFFRDPVAAAVFLARAMLPFLSVCEENEPEAGRTGHDQRWSALRGRSSRMAPRGGCPLRPGNANDDPLCQR